MTERSPSPLATSMRKLLSRRSLLTSAGVGVATIVLAQTVVGKDDAKDDHTDDSDHGDDKDHSGGSDDGIIPAGTVPAGSEEVRIDDDDADGFSPGTITIALGGSVTWVNVDKDPHTATGADFDTGRIDPGEQATVTFDEPGSFPYSCTFHPIMTGTVEVRDENGQVPARTAASPEASPAVSPQASPMAGQTEKVTIVDFAFDPQELEVTVGTTVEWTNSDTAPHTATAGDGEFDSDRLDQGDTFSHRFTKAGTYDYICSFHPNMTATITVTG